MGKGMGKGIASGYWWWHPRSGQLGEGDSPYPVDECVLCPSRFNLVLIRSLFDQMCRNGWYGSEWQAISLGRR